MATGFEPLAPEAEPVPAPVQDLDAVRGPVPEDEQVAAQGIGRRPGPDQGEQAVEPEPEIDRLGRIPQLDGRGDGQHPATPS
jgi:hypothetical protein